MAEQYNFEAFTKKKRILGFVKADNSHKAYQVIKKHLQKEYGEDAKVNIIK